jgi:4-hydroxy-tetrahydrodipicolinate synthase
VKYQKSEAKDYAKQNMRGVWGASLTPFKPDYEVDEEGFRLNIRYCIDNLQVEGMFLNGLMGEAFHQTVTERKRLMSIGVEESQGDMVIMPYTSDPVLENALEMTRYAEEIGADYAILINPKFYFGAMTDEGVFQYYKYIADRVSIGIALFNQVEQGYLMSPHLIDRIASDLENVVALKNIAPDSHMLETRILCGDKIVVSDAFEEKWFMNLTVKGQEAMIATVEPFCLQSRKLKLIKEYTTLAAEGEIAKAWEACKKLEPIRREFTRVTVPGKVQATYKYWAQFLGMAGGDGRVRPPQRELTETEKRNIERAVDATGLV